MNVYHEPIVQAAAYWLEAQWDADGPHISQEKPVYWDADGPHISQEKPVYWDADVWPLIERITSGRLQPHHLPTPPWRFLPLIVRDNASFLRALRTEISAGPRGTYRSKRGILQAELRRLAVIMQDQDGKRYGF